MRHVIRTAWLCAGLLSTALQAQAPLPPGTWRIADAPAELRDPIARADLLVISMQDALQRELKGALAKGGPAFAVNACHVNVMGITHRIGRQKGVAAGRTSDRLRNLANAPRPWAAPLVKANAGRFARDIDGFAVDLGDAVGVLRPIAHRAQCAACHGAVDAIDPGAGAALKMRYPADKAVGFREGEIRGWFWVEVPKNLR